MNWAELDVKELQLQQGDSSLYTSSTFRRENRAQKHINNPHVQGARTQDIQHNAGHPNSPTIHQVHASQDLQVQGWSLAALNSSRSVANSFPHSTSAMQDLQVLARAQQR